MPEITRQPTPGSQSGQGVTIKPSDWLPEMAKAELGKKIVDESGHPAIINKNFMHYEAIFNTLNHSETNPTGYDASLRLEYFKRVRESSIHVDGKYFNNLWAYMMQSIYTINQQMIPGGNALDTNEPGFFRRIINRVTGAKQEGTNGQ